MKIEITKDFRLDLNSQIRYISKDKPIAARKFKTDLIKNIKKDLKNPLHFKKSKYYDDENIRDYVFKCYTIVYYIDTEQEIVSVFGFIKHKNSL
ncbi:type II toxin-antitoxin system RelE/ParE family toxin [Flavobacterium sufflavum]|uniref:Type II toxin-antitoxin system RelE/ParE family toxin n=1 Tax=Flavobacterium sufflavum TaxID=1921138 RepID=A0A3S2XE22_9FLAO|nr:type II toxin-antitoxin system RelE/ParE family toxin [Flavobacterium sufflavum]RVT76595.1 type II toxin-antitoxin system RelE/ParE family toxin [Flavobacterium sufflavum]